MAKHTAGAIQIIFTALRNEERTLYGDNQQPLAIRTDFSAAIMSACLAEYMGGISLKQYLDKFLDIITGVESDHHAPLTLVLVRAAHLMKMNAKNVEACTKKTRTKDNVGSIKHLAMHTVGLLVHTKTLDDVINITKHALIAFTSETVTTQLTESFSKLTQYVNEFKVTEISEDRSWNEPTTN